MNTLTSPEVHPTYSTAPRITFSEKTGPFSVLVLVESGRFRMEASFMNDGYTWCCMRRAGDRRPGLGRAYKTYDAALASYKGEAARAMLCAAHQSAVKLF